ncbi:PaaI family thioesterase [Paenibacillus sp. MER TA 81-3]|uniref:PaaI family thioesterase n=1 Tax=Paenibacillus sp. MER TA 81-3 TaxID=2939573 RepID=UPI002040E391|nr:PaaI family thioesterase [Paenibacillus sp. MER TA 81-3]MCM3337409.1 PaaI family thioesterase [Paenibacillus sp. MER TA 81-3]
MSKENDDQMKRWSELAEQAQASFWGYLGCELVRVDEHEAVVRLKVEQHHLNMMGMVHGGVLSSLLDNTMGIAAAAVRPHENVVTSNLNVHFVHPLKSGTLEVRAHVVSATKRMLTLYGTVTDEQGRLGTMGTGTFVAKG